MQTLSGTTFTSNGSPCNLFLCCASQVLDSPVLLRRALQHGRERPREPRGARKAAHVDQEEGRDHRDGHRPDDQVPPVGLHGRAAQGRQDRDHERLGQAVGFDQDHRRQLADLPRPHPEVEVHQRAGAAAAPGETLQFQASAGTKLENISGASNTTVSWKASLQGALAKAAPRTVLRERAARAASCRADHGDADRRRRSRRGRERARSTRCSTGSARSTSGSAPTRRGARSAGSTVASCRARLPPRRALRCSPAATSCVRRPAGSSTPATSRSCPSIPRGS